MHVVTLDKRGVRGDWTSEHYGLVVEFGPS